MTKTTSRDRWMATTAHLGYVPAGLALVASIIWPQATLPLLALAALWTVFGLYELNQEPDSPFVREHVHQARRYHRRAAVATVWFIVAVFYLSVFTWGVVGAIGIILAPIALVAWMVPTWRAALAAQHGQVYRYEANRLTPAGRESAVLTRSEARAVQSRSAVAA